MSSLKPEVQKEWLYWVSGLLWLGSLARDFAREVS